MIAQLTSIPDNDVETRRARPSVPVAKLIAGRWCWKRFDSDEYVHEPDLERTLLAALARRERRKAA